MEDRGEGNRALPLCVSGDKVDTYFDPFKNTPKATEWSQMDKALISMLTLVCTLEEALGCGRLAYAEILLKQAMALVSFGMPEHLHKVTRDEGGQIVMELLAEVQPKLTKALEEHARGLGTDGQDGSQEVPSGGLLSQS